MENKNDRIFFDPKIRIESIEKLKQMFFFDEKKTEKANISILGHELVVDTLKQKGLSFDYTITKNQNGKPYFLYNDKIHFNISNTKSYVAIVLYDKQIGLDIEYLRQNKQNLATRFFHPMEQKYLLVNKTNYDYAFTQLWTIKEAYVKMTGTGIADNFSKYNLAPKIFAFNQSYNAYNHRIESYYDNKLSLFVSIVME